MSQSFGERVRSAFAPPRYIASQFSGIDLSTSGVKAARLTEGRHGFVLESYAEVKLPQGAFVEGEIIDHATITQALIQVAHKAGVISANVSLTESKSFIFEALVPGEQIQDWRLAIEQRLDELVPLPPQETAFDIVKTGRNEYGETYVTGVGFAQRVVDDVISVFDQAEIPINALECETFSMARTLLPQGDTSAVLIIDIGKTTTKLAVVVERIPRFTTTVNIGGHSLTLAVQKHFGVTEAEARRVKAERGIVPTPGNEDYVAAMLSTVSAIRDEIAGRLEYWQKKALIQGNHIPVSRAILVGGNASIRGLAEYLEGTLQIPVIAGDVFTNLASRDIWIPSLDYTESLAYTTAIGLALYDQTKSYE